MDPYPIRSYSSALIQRHCRNNPTSFPGLFVDNRPDIISQVSSTTGSWGVSPRYEPRGSRTVGLLGNHQIDKSRFCIQSTDTECTPRCCAVLVLRGSVKGLTISSPSSRHSSYIWRKMELRFIRQKLRIRVGPGEYWKGSSLDCFRDVLIQCRGLETTEGQAITHNHVSAHFCYRAYCESSASSNTCIFEVVPDVLIDSIVCYQSHEVVRSPIEHSTTIKRQLYMRTFLPTDYIY